MALAGDADTVPTLNSREFRATSTFHSGSLFNFKPSSSIIQRWDVTHTGTTERCDFGLNAFAVFILVFAFVFAIVLNSERFDQTEWLENQGARNRFSFRPTFVIKKLPKKTRNIGLVKESYLCSYLILILYFVSQDVFNQLTFSKLSFESWRIFVWGDNSGAFIWTAVCRLQSVKWNKIWKWNETK